MKKIVILTVLFVLGCASNSGVVPIGRDTFVVSRQASTGFSGLGTLKTEAFEEASEYCEELGKSLQVVSASESKPPYVLGNFPKAEVQFMCLDAQDAELSRPKSIKEADSTIEVKKDIRIKDESAKPNSIYSRLVELDDLRKRGILTDAEFDVQKQKLLSGN